MTRQRLAHTPRLDAWREHLLMRLQQQIAATGDAVLIQLHEELAAYPMPAMPDGEGVHRQGGAGPAADRRDKEDAEDLGGLVVPFRLQSPGGILSFIGTTTVFGSPTDVTLQELAIESFFPADEFTAEALRAAASGAVPT